MNKLIVILICLSVPSLASSQEAAETPQLTRENFTEWRDHVLPAEDELAWLQIPWRTTFADGIRAANQADRPLLLWVMNGHPLGCT